MLAGGLLGGMTALALTAIYYLGEMAVGLPFVPFDVFEGLIRILPGDVVTLFIRAMVSVIRGLQLGPTDEVAKLIEQSMAVGMMVVLGALFGGVLARLLARRGWAGSRAGAVGGLLLLVPVAAAEISSGVQSNPLLATLWVGATVIGWGALLGMWVEGAIRRAQRPVRAADQGVSRRAFLTRIAAGSLALAVAAFGLGRSLAERRRLTGAREPLSGTATPPSRAAAAVAVGRAAQPVPGTRPEVTPTDQFYRIDISLLPPTLDGASWILKVEGLFDRPRPLSLADLIAYPAITEPRTLSCISNPVGGDLIGTTYWTGLRIGDLMDDLGLRPEATALRIESADGFWEVVTRADLDDPRTLLVYGMDGETLSVEHGFPLRILIPNRYGMKQPKWITRIKAIDIPDLGYWVVRGWNQEARPQIVSVIDTVAKDQARDGRVPVGGIAWAGDRGIARVEVQVDSGRWEEATLLAPLLSPLAWVVWRYDWVAVPGRHTFRVRATDGTGVLQTEQEAPPEPDGATGYHSVSLTV